MGFYHITTFFSVLFFTAGFFYLLAEVFRLPSRRAGRKIRKAYHKGKAESRFLEIAKALGRFLPLSKSREERIRIKLKSAGISLLPRTYVASLLLKSGAVLGGAILSLPFIKNGLDVLFSIILFLISIFFFLNEYEKLEAKMKQKKETIEWELSRFTGSILQELHHHRDVVRMLESYKPSAGKVFAEELEITIADMKMGHLESALIRLDARLGIASVSSVVRGLISVIQGDNGLFYFQILEHDLKNLEYQKLKKIAAKRPGKVLKYSFLVFAAMLVIFVAVFYLQFAVAFRVFRG